MRSSDAYRAVERVRGRERDRWIERRVLLAGVQTPEKQASINGQCFYSTRNNWVTREKCWRHITNEMSGTIFFWISPWPSYRSGRDLSIEVIHKIRLEMKLQIEHFCGLSNCFHSVGAEERWMEC